MNGKEMLEAMSFVDEKYIEDAEIIPKRRPHWQPIAAAAACLVLVLIGAWKATPTKDAAPEMAAPEMAAAQMDEAAVYSGDTEALMPMVGAAAAKSAMPPEMTVTVLEQDGGTLRCTVDDPGTGEFAPGAQITVLLSDNANDTGDISVPSRLRITYEPGTEESTVTALAWEDAEEP